MKSKSNVTLILPVPPSINHCYRSYRGRVIKSKKYSNWQECCMLLAGKHECIEGQVSIAITVNPGHGWNPRRDIDNCIKPIIDFIKNINIIPDDNCKIVRQVSIKISDINPNKKVNSFISATISSSK